MFGLRNFSGSCWVNACLQALFRIPEVQERYATNQHDSSNPVDFSLHKIWNSQGKDGLQEFFQSVKTHTMPAGESIGDSHELFIYLCDQLPYLNDLCRFKIADSITCNNCRHREVKEDSVTEFSISSDGTRIPMTQCIMNTVVPYEIEDWTCEKCNKKGCTKQQLIGSFPKVMMFHMVSEHSSIDYTSILSVNSKHKYALSSVSCYNGFHWWGYGRDMPPGKSWYTFDDGMVVEHGPKEFPLSGKMRLLIYYRLNS
uniref:USP domain-containing protein n=1 Tax=viral metagenome TaxID=1070528 RepID=A0A6C0CHG8_9ZZZZ